MAQTYINDIICGTKSLSDIFQKLHILFKIFFGYNISIKSPKSYLNYQDLDFLGQQVNFFSFITSNEKLKAIYLLWYPETLRALEYYLDLIKYFKTYFHFYL